MEQNTPAKESRQPMGFGKTMLASALGVLITFVVFNILGFILMIGAIISLASMNDTKTITGKDIVLRFDLTNEVSERTSDNLQSLFKEEKTISMSDMLIALEEAKTDSRIKGIYLYMGSGASISWAQCEELRNALIEFKKDSGKPIVTYGDMYTQPALYLSSIADKVVLHPSGMVDFRGIGAEVMFFKDLLDKFNIHMELIRPQSNSYKSAGETYTMNHMSDANKEQIRAYISSIWNYVVANLATARNTTPEHLNEIADNLGGFLSDDAAKEGLVDTLAFEKYVNILFKENYNASKFISVSKYAKSITKKDAKDHIAIIYAEGDVVPGSGNGMNTAVYGDDIAKALDEAADNDNVKAIVLRVNSPGGAVTASEVMTDAVMRAKAKKPLIVSMSNLAASAGYEISCNADVIVAQPTTITGSIGVFATIPEIGSALRTKLGITTDTVMTNRNATGLSLMRPLSPDARDMMQRNVEDFYVTFCSRVAKGRNLTVEYVDSIARGRVWTGVEALRIGLVDTLGGLNTAISIAANKANITDFSIKEYPAEKKWYETLLEKDDETEINARINSIIPGYNELYYWATMEPMQARLPYFIDIR